MPDLPELNPTRQLEDLSQEFLLEWHTPLDVLSNSTLRLVAQLALNNSPLGLSDAELCAEMNGYRLNGSAPLTTTKAPMLGLVPNWLVPTGLAEPLPLDSDQVLRFRGTEAAKQYKPLLEVLALWQLRHPIPLQQITGAPGRRFQDLKSGAHPYSRGATGRLRAFQALATATGDKYMTAGTLAAAVPDPPLYVYRLYETTSQDGVTDRSSKYEPADRRLAISVTAERSRYAKLMEPARRSIYEAAVSLAQQGKEVVSGSELLDAAQRCHQDPRVDWKEIWDALTRRPPSVVRFIDGDVYGENKGMSHTKAAYRLRQDMRGPVTDLLLSICSLQDGDYREAVGSAAEQVFADRLSLGALLAAQPKRPSQQPNNNGSGVIAETNTSGRNRLESTAYSDLSIEEIMEIGGVLRRIYERVPVVRDQATALRNLSYLLEENLVVLYRPDNNNPAATHLAFTAEITSAFEPAELRALARLLRIEEIMYRGALPEHAIRAALRLPYSVTLGSFVRKTLLPRLEPLLPAR